MGRGGGGAVFAIMCMYMCECQRLEEQQANTAVASVKLTRMLLPFVVIWSIILKCVTTLKMRLINPPKRPADPPPSDGPGLRSAKRSSRCEGMLKKSKKRSESNWRWGGGEQSRRSHIPFPSRYAELWGETLRDD